MRATTRACRRAPATARPGGGASRASRGRAPRARSEKPEAPVTVALDARDLGGGVFEVTLTATPTVDTAQLALAIHPRAGAHVIGGDDRARLHGAPAGRPQTLVARVKLDGD